MSIEKLAAICAYLSEKFPGARFEKRQDFDLSAQVFKIHLSNSVLLLKIADEFVADNTIEQISHIFERHSLAEVLNENSENGVLISDAGLTIFERN